MKIEICQRDNGTFHAKIATGNESGVWGAGETEQEAIGALVRDNPELFDLKIVHLKKKR